MIANFSTLYEKTIGGALCILGRKVLGFFKLLSLLKDYNVQKWF